MIATPSAGGFRGCRLAGNTLSRILISEKTLKRMQLNGKRETPKTRDAFSSPVMEEIESFVAEE